jgi:hypothetical protein
MVEVYSLVVSTQVGQTLSLTLSTRHENPAAGAGTHGTRSPADPLPPTPDGPDWPS